MNWRNQKGVNLIESMVGLSILSVAIYAGMSLMSAQTTSNKTRNLQSMYRFLALQTTAQVTSNPEAYPPLAFSSSWDDSRDIVVYVGCYDKKGSMMPNDLGKREFAFHQMPREDLDVRAETGRCPASASGVVTYEVRFWFKDPVTREVAVEVTDMMILRSRNARATPRQRFTFFR